ncbi:secretin N-terminal domain-containing protein [Pseudoduganella armeniaca]|uniref:General secretion pathway protein GspD n=1 Tax=Pseudoduganella armeniaca TaxID=2072590 RepID=A0A2R4C8X8_9BURK|nr:secretin N-terminal domain-containing protein [Pseudoduganella armeniaca]AVR96000.1 general secretion pathway protein GspD [Pseudoduganella armeniaca]
MSRQKPTATARLRRTLTLSTMVLALSGCAAQMAYRDARDLIEKDQVEAGLLKLQEAISADPGNAQYRATYLQARDRAIMRYLDQAERQTAEGQRALALQNIQRVLALNPQNERARNALRALDMAERHERLLADAKDLVAKGEFDQARAKVEVVLTEKPDQSAARALQREIAEKNPPGGAENQLAKTFKQPITIEFRDAPLKQVFDVISRRSGLNFVFDKDVKADARTTIALKNSTVESAVYYLLMTNQLEQQVMDANTILIYPNIAAKLKEYQETVIKTFYLANAEAKLVANTLKTILKSRDVVADEKLNLVIMRDNADAIKLAEKIVALQDMAEPEVMLEVEILEVKRSRLLELGVSWPTSATFSPLISSGGSTLTINDLDTLNARSIGVSSLSAKITANKTDGDSNLLANPRIRVRNKQKAKILIGDKVPVITTTVSPGTAGFAQESVSYVDVGLTLNAEPTIYLNNEIAINVSLEVSNIVNRIETKTGTTAYQIGTRQATTVLQLKDGENQVLAGLINSEDRKTGTKVPGFGDVPILGRLFGTQSDDKQKTEIVLSITPRLIRNLQRPQADASEFSAGTEANFRRKPDITVRAQVLPPARSGGTPALEQPQVPQVPQPQPPQPPTPTPQETGTPTGVPLSTAQPGPASSVTQPPGQPQPQSQPQSLIQQQQQQQQPSATTPTPPAQNQ